MLKLGSIFVVFFCPILLIFSEVDASESLICQGKDINGSLELKITNVQDVSFSPSYCTFPDAYTVSFKENRTKFSFERQSPSWKRDNTYTLTLLPDGKLIGHFCEKRLVLNCNMGRQEVLGIYKHRLNNIVVNHSVKSVTNVVTQNAELSSVSTTNSNIQIVVAQQNIDALQNQIVLFSSILTVIQKRDMTKKQRVLSTVSEEIDRLLKEKKRLQDEYEKQYLTTIKPKNANLNQTSFRAAEVFPKVPYYIPGTNETGMLNFTSRITNGGDLEYILRFVDPTSEVEKIRDEIIVSNEMVPELITGLSKILDWTETAQKNGINRRLEKQATCISSLLCKEKISGNYSSELLFQTYEDGSTSGKFQINKGTYSFGYNLSVESSILLTAYLVFMEEIGEKEYNAKSMSDEQILELFE